VSYPHLEHMSPYRVTYVQIEHKIILCMNISVYGVLHLRRACWYKYYLPMAANEALEKSQVWHVITGLEMSNDYAQSVSIARGMLIGGSLSMMFWAALFIGLLVNGVINV